MVHSLVVVEHLVLAVLMEVVVLMVLVHQEFQVQVEQLVLLEQADKMELSLVLLVQAVWMELQAQAVLMELLVQAEQLELLEQAV
jgi:hypothetical protein